MRLDDDSSGVSVPLAALELYYTPEELKAFLTFRLAGLSHYSLGWPRRAAAAFWESTQWTNISTTAVYLQFNDQDLQDVYANVPFLAAYSCSTNWSGPASYS